MIKERPILFNTQMVRAILEGRKTQTRRILNCDHPVVTGFIPNGPYYWQGTAISKAVEQQYISTFPRLVKCPFGAVGNRLWVREKWRKTEISECGCSDNCNCNFGRYDYFASSNDTDAKWKPSIHMPRSACRLILEITNIRVERLNDISQIDSIREGCHGLHEHDLGDETKASPKEQFKALWQEINGTDSWAKNPWVWVIEFRVIEGGAA